MAILIVAAFSSRLSRYMRPHFVKARVKVHLYADGSHALFHGPRCIGRYDQNGTIRDAKNAA